MAAAEAGADAIGLVFWPRSPRAVTVDEARAIGDALPPFVVRVGVFVDAGRDEMARVADAVRLDLLQLHGDEPPEALDAPAAARAQGGPRRGRLRARGRAALRGAGGGAPARHARGGRARGHRARVRLVARARRAGAVALPGARRGLAPENVARHRGRPPGRCRRVERARVGAGQEGPRPGAGLRGRGAGGASGPGEGRGGMSAQATRHAASGPTRAGTSAPTAGATSRRRSWSRSASWRRRTRPRAATRLRAELDGCCATTWAARRPSASPRASRSGWAAGCG